VNIFIDLVNKRFGKLLVLEKDNERSKRRTYWVCQCDCLNKKSIRQDSLISKATTSCGKCSYNTYKFYKDYVEVFGTNGLSFYIDLDDYKKVSEHTWRVNKKNKRVYATINKETICIHQFILNVNPEAIDHADGNPSNNRRYNLRICKLQENSFNVTIKNTNTSGVTGVWYSKHWGRWMAELNINGIKHRKGFVNYIDAVIQRIRYEVKYFKEFRCNRNDEYLNHLLKQHNYDLYKIIKEEEEKLLKLKTG